MAHYLPERIATQLEYLDWNLAQDEKKISDPTAYLVKAIQKDYAAPKGFVSRAEQAEREDAEREERQQAELAKKRQDAEQARERAVQARILKYWNTLSLDEQKKLEAEALDQAEGALASAYREMQAKRNPVTGQVPDDPGRLKVQ